MQLARYMNMVSLRGIYKDVTCIMHAIGIVDNVCSFNHDMFADLTITFHLDYTFLHNMHFFNI